MKKLIKMQDLRSKSILRRLQACCQSGAPLCAVFLMQLLLCMLLTMFAMRDHHQRHGSYLPRLNHIGKLSEMACDPISCSRAGMQPQSAVQHDAEESADRTRLPTKVIYVFSDTDPEYINNLRFFVEHGVKHDDGNEYLIVINQVDTTRYTYFVFVNSSVRGPFLPAYWPQSVPWTRIFTDRIRNETKLVGPTISCEGIQPYGFSLRKNPHVQSFVIATDREGLAILHANEVFKCYQHIHHTMFFSEAGASRAILKANYNLDCLMLRYQGIDWRDRSNWQCNANSSPYKAGHYDGIDLDPLEVLFVKVKDPLLELRSPSSLKAAKYDAWLSEAQLPVSEQPLKTKQSVQQGLVVLDTVPADDSGTASHRNISSNQYDEMPYFFKKPVVLTPSGNTINGRCFDVNFYRGANPELSVYMDGFLLDHFAQHGQFEGRPFRLLPKPCAGPAS